MSKKFWAGFCVRDVSYNTFICQTRFLFDYFYVPGALLWSKNGGVLKGFAGPHSTLYNKNLVNKSEIKNRVRSSIYKR